MTVTLPGVPAFGKTTYLGGGVLVVAGAVLFFIATGNVRSSDRATRRVLIFLV